ncbi:MAG: hypothetical protein AB7T31_17845 [Gemmatimonadales bacterium]
MSTTEQAAPIEGRFETAESAAQAVEHLIDANIPTDQIDVYTIDRSGNRGPKAKMSQAPGVKRGALIGAAVGAVFGLLAFIAVGVTGSFGVDDVATLTAVHALYYIGACAAAGVPLGAAIGMTGWIGKRRLDTAGSHAQSFVVVVRTDSLGDEARHALRAAGATDVA